MTVRTPCGHKPTARAYRIGYLPDGAEWTLCGRPECEDEYNGATQSRDAEGLRGASEKCAPNAGEHVGSGAGAVDAVLAPHQSSLFA